MLCTRDIILKAIIYTDLVAILKRILTMGIYIAIQDILNTILIIKTYTDLLDTLNFTSTIKDTSTAVVNHCLGYKTV